uniref:RRM domain-containing protein n=1 Tax=Timema poppense TaxID=170557 RepID=A0A7R9H6B7_TIMPO|nr:unnamed protein product [Timema poppensis]
MDTLSPQRSHHRGRSYSRSRSHSRSKKMSYRGRYRSRSRSRSPKRYRSRYSHSRSRSYSPRGKYYGYSDRRKEFYRSHSRSPMSSRRRHVGSRDNPQPSRCLGVFGLSIYTTEQQMHHIMSKYGPVERVQVVIDAKTGRSRGFSFVYFESSEDAKVAKEQCTGMEIDACQKVVGAAVAGEGAEEDSGGESKGAMTTMEAEGAIEVEEVAAIGGVHHLLITGADVMRGHAHARILLVLKEEVMDEVSQVVKKEMYCSKLVSWGRKQKNSSRIASLLEDTQ